MAGWQHAEQGMTSWARTAARLIHAQLGKLPAGTSGAQTNHAQCLVLPVHHEGHPFLKM